MAEKEVVKQIKLQIEAGKATPAPPVGPALGSSGINIMQFVKEFNDRTASQAGLVIPVVISVYKDKSFDFITKVPPVAVLIKKAIGIQKGSGKPNKEKVAKITKEQVRAIAEQKMPDLNAYTIEAAMKIIEGTARNMGIAVEGINDEELKEQALEAKEAEIAEAKREAALEKMEESANNNNAEVEVIGENKETEEN